MEEHGLSKNDRRRRWRVELMYVKQQLKCMKLYLGMDDEMIETLWVSVKEQASMGDIVVGVCYRLPDQEEKMGEKRLAVDSQLQNLFLMECFDYPDICFYDHETEEFRILAEGSRKIAVSHPWTSGE